MFVVMLFFVLTNAASINLKKRQDFPPSLIQGQKCTGVGDDSFCTTGICRVNGLDTLKCQLTDERPEGASCPKDAACQAGLVCGNDGLCQPNTTQTKTTQPKTTQAPTTSPTNTPTTSPTNAPK
ncbi:hypothetical protein F8M41_025558 [Gigaspora margarita]|uniref:Uncharacterized protein n=1 Tax=Gigaspora margarita TaxID=4874 RepID=A0A8H4B023_GIGMA|nr:hypothetical protein F8M41_025558 [Gigaspora margarita]